MSPESATSVVAAPAAPPVRIAEVDDRGVVLPAGGEDAVVVSFDGRYVWAFTPTRDGSLQADGRTLVPWPTVLLRFLVGRARIRVASPDGSDVLFDDQVSLGLGSEPIRIVDPQGLPLAVDKVGHLCRAFEDTSDTIRNEILVGTRRVLDDLRERCGLDAYLNYGALLGAVRDGAMIAHDSDTDLCYLSRHDSPADLIAESYAIERRLRALGWQVLRMSGGDIKLLLPLSDGRLCHIDVFVAFHVDGTFYQLGNRSGRLDRASILPVSEIELHGVTFEAPADPEAMLRFVYGPRWRVPDPAFKYADPPVGVRKLDGWLRGFRSDMGAWTGFHQSPDGQRLPMRQTGFARWTQQRIAPGEAIADLGSGNGRDSLWFAEEGHPVRAFEFSRAARAGLQRRSDNRSAGVDTRLLNLGELRSVLVTGAELAREPHHLYARHLVGCLDDPARHNLWRLASMALRGGRRLFLEFSAVGPETGPADPLLAPDGLIRRVDPDRVRNEIEAAGGIVLRDHRAAGFDYLGRPDPSVCRLVVRWPHPTRKKN